MHIFWIRIICNCSTYQSEQKNASWIQECKWHEYHLFSGVPGLYIYTRHIYIYNIYIYIYLGMDLKFFPDPKTTPDPSRWSIRGPDPWISHVLARWGTPKLSLPQRQEDGWLFFFGMGSLKHNIRRMHYYIYTLYIYIYVYLYRNVYTMDDKGTDI